MHHLRPADGSHARKGEFIMKQITVIGIGMGNPDTLTLEGKKYMEEAEAYIGARRMVEAVNSSNKPAFISYDGKEIRDYIRSSGYGRYAVLMSGDTGFYSGAVRLLPLLEEYDVKVLPGISTVSYFSAKLQISWEDACLLSLHGRNENIVQAVKRNEKTFVLTDGKIRDMCRKLTQAGLGRVRVYVGENLSYDLERISEGRAEEFTDKDFEPLSAAFVLNPDYKTEYGIGIPEEEFIRGNVPITKSEVRAISISKLKLKEDSVVYDIGAGTGSVSVEMAHLVKKGRVYAIEQKEEAAELIEQNKDKFALDNMVVITGCAPEAIEQLEAPDAAFIGGSGGNLKDIITSLLDKNRAVRIVVNAIALETLTEALSLMKEPEFEETEVVQAAISKTRKAGNYHMLMGQNPVFIISGRGKTN